MLHTIKHVEHVEMYRLKLSFNDGKIKVVDFENRLKEAKNMFLPLKDVEYFKKVKTDGTTIVWPNGLDLCPDALYDMGFEVERKKQVVAKRKLSSKRSVKNVRQST